MTDAAATREGVPDHAVMGEGRPIITLPGMEGAKEFWRHQWSPLVAAGYRVVACGHRRRRPRVGAAVADYAGDVLRLMDALAIERAAVLGESFGGMVAQELATEHPDRVAALALCNTLDRARRGGIGLNAYTAATLVHPLAFVAPRAWRKPMLGFVGRHRGFVMDPSEGNGRLADYFLEHGLDPGLGGYLDRILAGVRARYTERLASIQAPTLVLRGVEDRVVLEDAVVALVGRIPNAELALIDGGGHCCQYTLPEQTNRALLTWLARIGY